MLKLGTIFKQFSPGCCSLHDTVQPNEASSSVEDVTGEASPPFPHLPRGWSTLQGCSIPQCCSTLNAFQLWIRLHTVKLFQPSRLLHPAMLLQPEMLIHHARLINHEMLLNHSMLLSALSSNAASPRNTASPFNAGPSRDAAPPWNAAPFCIAAPPRKPDHPPDSAQPCNAPQPPNYCFIPVMLLSAQPCKAAQVKEAAPPCKAAPCWNKLKIFHCILMFERRFKNYPISDHPIQLYEQLSYFRSLHLLENMWIGYC